MLLQHISELGHYFHAAVAVWRYSLYTVPVLLTHPLTLLYHPVDQLRKTYVHDFSDIKEVAICNQLNTSPLPYYSMCVSRVLQVTYIKGFSGGSILFSLLSHYRHMLTKYLLYPLAQ